MRDAYGRESMSSMRSVIATMSAVASGLVASCGGGGAATADAPVVSLRASITPTATLVECTSTRPGSYKLRRIRANAASTGDMACPGAIIFAGDQEPSS